MTIQEFLKNTYTTRSDLSPFLVHITRNIPPNELLLAYIDEVLYREKTKTKVLLKEFVGSFDKKNYLKEIKEVKKFIGTNASLSPQTKLFWKKEIMNKSTDFSKFQNNFNIDNTTNMKSILKKETILKGFSLPDGIKDIVFGSNEYFPGVNENTYKDMKPYFRKRLGPQHVYWEPNKNYDFLKVICLTETPLNCIQNMIEINKKVTLKTPIKKLEYGIVLIADILKRNLRISPVLNFNCWQPRSSNERLYLNKYGKNTESDHYVKWIMEALWFYAENQIAYETQNQEKMELLYYLLALIKPFGLSTGTSEHPIDYYWEREWRSFDNIELIWNQKQAKKHKKPINVFMVICPEEKKDSIIPKNKESEFQDLLFIDAKNLNDASYNDQINKRVKYIEDSIKGDSIIKEQYGFFFEYMKHNYSYNS